MGLNHVDEGTQKELHLLAHLYPEHSIQHVFAVHKGLKAVVVRWRVNQLRVPCEVTACFQGLSARTLPVLLLGVNATIGCRTEDPERALPTDQHAGPCDPS